MTIHNGWYIKDYQEQKKPLMITKLTGRAKLRPEDPMDNWKLKIGQAGGTDRRTGDTLTPILLFLDLLKKTETSRAMTKSFCQNPKDNRKKGKDGARKDPNW